MQIETIRATLTADSAQFVTGMNRAKNSMGDFVTRSGQSNRAMGIMRNGMVALATQAAGVQSSVGRLAQGLLMLGGGGSLVLGVAAGIGAIAYAYKVLTRDTKEAEEAQKELIKTLQGVGVHAVQTAAKIQLGMAREKLGDVDNPSGFWNRIADVFRSEGQRETRRQEALRGISAAENAVARAAQEVAKWQQDIADNAEREAAARLRSLMALDKIIAKVPPKELIEAGRLKGLNSEGAVGGKFDFEAMRDSLNSLPGKMRYGLEQAGISENMREFGISVGRQFAMGILEGIQSMQDLFKMVISSILDFALGSLLGSIFPPAAAVGGVKGSAVGPASMSLNVSGMPKASTPMAAARDAQWQSFLRESILVAGSQGFHG